MIDPDGIMDELEDALEGGLVNPQGVGVEWEQAPGSVREWEEFQTSTPWRYLKRMMEDTDNLLIRILKTENDEKEILRAQGATKFLDTLRTNVEEILAEKRGEKEEDK